MGNSTEQLVEFTKHDKITVGTIRAASVLSTINAAQFGQEVLQTLKAQQEVNLLLNFEHVDYLSSVVLTELLRIKRLVDERGGRMRLCAVSSMIREVFEITNLDSLFPIQSEDVGAALKKFQRALAIAEQEAAWKDPNS